MHTANTSPRPTPSLKRTSVLLLILLTVLSVGPYYPIWFLRRRGGLNLLNSPIKLKRWPFIVAIVFIFAQLLFTAGTGPRLEIQPTGEHSLVAVFFGLRQFALAILMLFQHLCVKGMIEDHLAGSSEDGVMRRLSYESVKLSGACTVFLGIFYLQHVINTRVVGALTEAA